MSPTPKHALMPHHHRPTMIDSHPHWVVRGADGTKLATIYTSEATGHGAEFASEVGGSLTCLIIPGSPCLPLTAPEAAAPLAWTDVCAEVGAMLAADGWVVCWPASDTDHPVWSDQEAEFFDSVADHAYAEGRTEAARDFAAERASLRAERDAAVADAAGWRSYAATAAKLDAAMSASHEVEIEAWRAFGLDIVKLLASPGEEGCEAPDLSTLPGLRDDVMGLVAEVARLRAVIAEAAAALPLHPADGYLAPPEDDAEAVRVALLAALGGGR